MEINPKELDNFFKELFLKRGYDFRNYAKASIERRVSFFSFQHEIESLADLKKKIMNSGSLFDDFVLAMTVQVTEMFRDPEIYKVLREKVFPILETYPRIKIWHAGCSSGEEVYSLAILLHESGLLGKSLLYGTDINQNALKLAHEGCFPLRSMKLNTKNYQAKGVKEAYQSIIQLQKIRFRWLLF